MQAALFVLACSGYLLGSPVASKASASAPARSRVPSCSADVPSIIYGGGRIGSLLADLGVAGDEVVKRGDPFPASPVEGPIYVCTRNDALAGIIEATPPERRADLVFMQNGMLGSFLEGEGLADNTQASVTLPAVRPAPSSYRRDVMHRRYSFTSPSPSLARSRSTA